MNKLIKLSLLTCLLFAVPTVGSAQYYVQKGDTMSGIAKKFGMTYQDLLLLNPHIKNPNLITLNQFIVIRSKDKAQDLIEYARSLQDQTKYVFGADYSLSPTKADCSSWTKHIYAKFGITLPRVSQDQARTGTPIKFPSLKKGDLMFFGDAGKVTHVGIYMGDGYWISNLNTQKSVVILSVWGSWSQERFLWATRVL